MKDNVDYIEKIRQATEELRQGKQNYLPVIYQALASKDEEVVRYAASAITKYMTGLDSASMIRLDERFREYSSMEWNISWERIDLNA